MFEDLDWRGAAKRAAFTVLLYIGLVYVLNVAVPESAVGPAAMAINAAVLFAIFTVFHAFIDRRRRRRAAGIKVHRKKTTPGAKKGGADTTDTAAEDDEEETEAGGLKGRQNPNTSRKKASRRRR